MLAQDREAVRRYIEETGLPFDILIDERRDMLRAYGVWHRVGLDAWNIARPAVFLDQPGRTHPVLVHRRPAARIPDAGGDPRDASLKRN